jgi:hypothetical protein
MVGTVQAAPSPKTSIQPIAETAVFGNTPSIRGSMTRAKVV